MKQRDSQRREWNAPPQPLAEQGEQRPDHLREQEELDAFSAWLAHVEAGRIGA